MIPIGSRKIITILEQDIDEQEIEELMREKQKERPELTTKLRHVDIHHFWLRQAHQQSIVEIQWTPTTEMIADGMTKSLVGQGHDHFVEQLEITKKAL